MIVLSLLLAGCAPEIDPERTLEEGGTYAAWMAGISDATPLAGVSVPGAHDAGTATIRAWPQWTKTQELTVAELWNCGVRAFDLRPAYVNGGMGVFHDKYSAGVSFPEVLTTLLKALDRNPSEFAVMLIRHEVEADDDTPAWSGAMRDILSAHAGRLAGYHAGITVGELRGKILVLSRNRYDGGPFGGYIAGWYSGTDLTRQQAATLEDGAGEISPLWVQDYYDPEGADDKWKEVRAMLEATAAAEATAGASAPGAAPAAPAGPRPLVINHASGYVGKLPNYRKNANAINSAAAEYIRKNHRPAGIVMMDFAGAETSRGVSVYGAELVRVLVENNR